MGLYLLRDGDEEDQSFFASWGGMRELTEFINANRKQYPTLAEFSDQGYSDNPAQLAVEATQAAKGAGIDNARVLLAIADIAKTAEVQVLIV